MLGVNPFVHIIFVKYKSHKYEKESTDMMRSIIEKLQKIKYGMVASSHGVVR